MNIPKTSSFSGTILLLQVLLIVVFGTAWLANLYRFVKCDFEAPWKGEVIHAVGLVVPPAALVTMWFNDK